MPVEQNKEKNKTAKQQQHTNKSNKQGKVNGWPVRNVNN